MPLAIPIAALLATLGPTEPLQPESIWGQAAASSTPAPTLDPTTFLSQSADHDPADLPLNGLFGTPFTTRIYWENDGALHDPTDGYDRHYTNGFAVTLEHKPDWAQNLAKTIPAPNVDTRQATTAAGYVMGQLIFTPENTEATAPIPGDQSYAGYLYAGVFWQRQAPSTLNPDVAVLDHLELNAGIIGPSSVAEDIQKWVHDNFQGDELNGWSNQRDDEGAVQFYLRRKWRFDTADRDRPLLGNLQSQIIPQVGLAVGTVYRHAEVGVTYRIGHNLPNDFGPGRINDLQSAAGNRIANPGWSWYAWGRVGGRAVQYNTFLDGSEFKDPSLSVDSNPLVADAGGGLAIGYQTANHALEFSWGLTFNTDQFDGPGNEGTDSYGTWVLSYTYGF